MEKILFNSLIKSTQKPNSPHLWLNILSAIKEKKNIPKQGLVDDYIIEYSLVFEKENKEKIKVNGFTYKAYLSEFANKEKSFISQLIKMRAAIEESATTAVAEVAII